MDFTYLVNQNMDFASLFTKLLIARNRELGNYKNVWKLSYELDCIIKAKRPKDEKVNLEGYCCKNYEPVKDELKKMLLSGGEENVQLCVYVEDKCVVDLYGTAIGK